MALSIHRTLILSLPLSLPQGVAFRSIRVGPAGLWPAVGLHASGVALTVEHRSAAAFRAARAQELAPLAPPPAAGGGAGVRVEVQFDDGEWYAGTVEDHVAGHVWKVRTQARTRAGTRTHTQT